MNYADFKKFDTLNGQGIRHSLFVSGCSHRCKGCFNAVAWNPNYGKKFTEETEEMILASFRNTPVEMSGLSLLGGEPFENMEGLIPFLKKFKKEFPNMTIWCWTGYVWEDLIGTEMLEMIDVLIDGKFMLEQKDLKLKFRGSSNQRIIDVKKSMETNSIVLWGDKYDNK